MLKQGLAEKGKRGRKSRILSHSAVYKSKEGSRIERGLWKFAVMTSTVEEFLTGRTPGVVVVPVQEDKVAWIR
jgi:hypothetical protein